MIVYAVSSGEYSAYEIEHVFSTAEAAQAYIDASDRGVGEAQIEEWTVHESHGEPVRWWRYLSIFDRDGNVPPPYDTLDSTRTHDAPYQVWVHFPALGDNPPAADRSIFAYDYGVPRLQVMVSGIDHDRVRKVFTEMRARALAEFDVHMERERQRKREAP